MEAVLALLVASLLGSPHCAAMCGGFVTLYSADTKSSWLSHVEYSCGRLATYLALGIFASAVGRAVDSAGILVGVQRISLYLVGAGLVVFGLSGLVNWVTPGKFVRDLQRKLSAVVIKLAPRFIEKKGISKPFLIGVTTTLLPCGWLYSFVIVAAAAESSVQSLLVMFVFWLGTLPVMLSLGVFARGLLGKSSRYFPRLSAALVFCAGIFCLLQHSQIQSALHSYTCHGAAEHRLHQ